MKKEWILQHLPLSFAIAAFLILLPAIIIADMPVDDVLSRYAPMAEAFSRGDWSHAFHPRIPFLLPVVSGCFIKIFCFTPFFAVKFTSVLFFALTFFLLIPLFQRIFPQKVAILAGCLAVFSPQVMRITICGLRESGKAFCFILCVYALVVLWQERRSWKAQLLLACGCGGMLYTRDETVLFACFFLFAAFCFEIFRGKHFPWRTACVSFPLMLAVITPLLCVNYKITGYPVPSHRFIFVAEAIQNKWGLKKADDTAPQEEKKVEEKKETGKNADSSAQKVVSETASPARQADSAKGQGEQERKAYEKKYWDAYKLRQKSKEKYGAADELMKKFGNNRAEVESLLAESKVLREQAIALLEQIPEQKRTREMTVMLNGLIELNRDGRYILPTYEWSEFWEMLFDVLEGFVLLFFLPALVGIFLRIYHREFRVEEAILLVCIALHSVLIVLQIAVADHKFFFTPRYGVGVSILFCPWTAVCILYAYGMLKKYVFERFSVPAPWRRKIVLAICFIAGIGLYCDGMNSEIREVTSSGKRAEVRATKSFAAAILQDYKGPEQLDWSRSDKDVYSSDKRPFVYSEDLPRIGFFADGENLPSLRPKDGPEGLEEQLSRFNEVLSVGIPVDYCTFTLQKGEKLPAISHFEVLKEEQFKDKKFVLLKNLNGGY